MATTPASEGGPFKPIQRILEQEIGEAELELRRPPMGLFISGLLAGICIGVAVLLIAVVMKFDGPGASSLTVELCLALAYAVGFVVVILGRMDLFTEYTTMAILPVLHSRASLGQLARLWALVYLGNLLGAAVISVLLAVIVPALGVSDAAILGRLAQDLIHPSWWIVLLSALLAGWLMGLLSWLVTASRETISQLVHILLVTGAIGFAHLHHSITGSVEVLTGLFAGEPVTWMDFGYFLLWATVGNAVGGIVFALMIHHSTLLSSSGRGAGEESGK